MIQAHGFDSWLTAEARTGVGYDIIRHLSSLPSRLFLFLVGVSAAIRFDRHLALASDTEPPRKQASMRREVATRGLQMLGLAYLFRLQEHTLAGFRGGWDMLGRVDILNAIGASLLLIAAVAVPRGGRRQIIPALLLAAVLVGLGPIVGPAHFPQWLPRPLTSYIGGQRPMSWFPIFPWGAWALVGVAVGHLWVRESVEPRRQARCFLLGGVIGLVTAAAVLIDVPRLVLHPSDPVRQMGLGSFLFRLGIIGVLAALAWAVTRRSGARFSPLRQLGHTSLLIYWIHVDICYGFATRSIRKQLDIPKATLAIALLTVAMLGVSVFKTRLAARRKHA